MTICLKCKFFKYSFDIMLSEIYADLWKHCYLTIHTYLNPYNWMGDYVYHFTQYMFTARCKCENVDQFTKFIAIVTNVDWSISHPLYPFAPTNSFFTTPLPQLCLSLHTTGKPSWLYTNMGYVCRGEAAWVKETSQIINVGNICVPCYN
jgi:hypothetical protein